MFEKKFIVIVTVVSVVAILGGVALGSRSSGDSEAAQVNVSESANAIPATNETSYDWGTIKLNGGNVEKVFEIKNEGTETLLLSNVATSCMCTTAILARGEETSPEFGMHSKSNYVMEVPAGETANLKITFDPAFHGPSGVGPINRQIKVDTNNPEKPVLAFTLTAMVER